MFAPTASIAPWIVVALFGLVAGSFLTVCVERLPMARSIVRPGSRCPDCRRPLTAIENLPVLSYLLQRGRCRGCGLRIPLRYPLIELATAAGYLLGWHRYGASAAYPRFCFFWSAMVVLAVTDWRERQLPDEVTLGGAVAGLAAAWWLPPPQASPGLAGLEAAAIGGAVGAGLLAAVSIGYRLWRGREGLGRGDIKMMALIGVFAGLRLALVTLLLAALGGALFGLSRGAGVLVARWRRERQRGHRQPWRRAQQAASTWMSLAALPLGLYLAASALVAWGWGLGLWQWYAALTPLH